MVDQRVDPEQQWRVLAKVELGTFALPSGVTVKCWAPVAFALELYDAQTGQRVGMQPEDIGGWYYETFMPQIMATLQARLHALGDADPYMLLGGTDLPPSDPSDEET